MYLDPMCKFAPDAKVVMNIPGGGKTLSAGVSDGDKKPRHKKRKNKPEERK